LSLYTKNFRYLTASSKAGNIRVDLEGNQAGEITEEQAKYAEEKLNELKEKRKQREKAHDATDVKEADYAKHSTESK
jgi:ProP effector